MKLSNRLNLPDAIVQAVRNDSYTMGDADISITSLIAPARKVALERLHAEEITEDASDRIFSLLGQSIHTILERANKTGIAERRLSMDVLGWKVSGGMDLYLEGGKLIDYKVTTMWQFLDGKVPESFTHQLNLYAELLRRNGHPVTSLEVVAILRDWSKNDALRNEGVPRAQVVVKEIELWPTEKATAYLEGRIKIHQLARSGNLPDCTPEERWARPDKWAVMKTGRQSAVRVYDSEIEATGLAGTDKTFTVVKRPGDNIRCNAYCGAAPFCSQRKAMLE